MSQSDDLERQAAAVRRVETAKAGRAEWTQEFFDSIVAAGQAGVRTRTIAIAAGVDESRVRQILREVER